MHELAYKGMTEAEKKNLSATKTLGINLGSGIVAGFAAAILSHPADTLLSQINKGHGPEGTMITRLAILAKEAGFRGLFAGLGPRMVMSASSSALASPAPHPFADSSRAPTPSQPPDSSRPSSSCTTASSLRCTPRPASRSTTTRPAPAPARIPLPRSAPAHTSPSFSLDAHDCHALYRCVLAGALG